MLINGALSALFVFLIFGGRDQVELWGMHGLALDFVPQTFIIAFMATLVPSAITRKAVRNGRVSSDRPLWLKLPRRLLVRSLSVATFVSAITIPFAITAVEFASDGHLSFATILPMKVAYGACLACVVTSFAICASLSDGDVQ
jgi:hypothetical protein